MNKIKKDRILLIATSPLYLEKGSSLRTYAILKILSEYYKIDLVCYSIGRQFCLNNVNIYRTPKWFKPRLSIGEPTLSKILLDFLIWIKAFRLSLTNQYDVIHCEDYEGIAIGSTIKFLNKKSKLVYNLHNRITDNLRLKKQSGFFNLIYLKLEKIFIKKTDKIILNWGKYLKDDFFRDKKKFLYYDPIESDVKQINLPAKNYLIYSGNFEDYQGLQHFIPIFVGIEHDIKLVLVGQPTVKIADLIRELKSENRVLLMGRLPVDQTNYLIKNSIAGVLPRLEGSSMKAIHYFFWSKPVIATDTVSNRELIKDGLNGFLYASDAELSEKLSKICRTENLENLRRGVEVTQKIISTSYNKKEFIEEYIK